MKIGIATINDNNNYGNRLQNYATQQGIKKILAEDIEIYTIKNEAVINKKVNIIEYMLRYIKYIQIKVKTIKKNRTERARCFKEFNKNIKYTKKTFNWQNTKKYKTYDYCITGSDQVWNPYYRLSEFDLLEFIDGSKRIAYSASIATESIPESRKEYARSSFLKFKAISVREEKGKEIIKELTNRQDVEVLLDPTMLLSSQEWDKVSKRPKQLDNIKTEKYILNYFLGELPEEWSQEINRIAKENNCEVINILDKNSPFYQTGPSEFLYLEKNAFLVCTDSFHSSVFSILYNTPFIVFNRKQNGVVSMNSRIDTLLSKFGLENRRFNNKITEDLLYCDYTKAEQILESEREKSLNFLKKSLNN